MALTQSAGRFRFDSSWLEVDLAAEPQRWAHEQAVARFDASGLPYDETDVDRLAAGITALADNARRHPVTGAYILCPDAVYGPRVMLEVSSIGLPADLTAATLDASVSLPDERLLEPIEAADLQSPAGTARRIIQRWHDEDTRVYEWVTYTWLLPDAGVVVTAAAMFHDLTLARLCRDRLDAFAATFEVEPG